MSVQPQKRWTSEEYLAFERSQDERHELINGEIVMMSGASRTHNIIVANTVTTLTNQLEKRPCEIYPSDMRVRVNARNYFYPDVVVVCGDPILEDASVDTLLNPTVIFEVLSPSTKKFDRKSKFAGYRQISSLREYLMISQDEPRLEHFTLMESGVWQLMDVIGLQTQITLASIACTLELSRIYNKITFENEFSNDSP